MVPVALRTSVPDRVQGVDHARPVEVDIDRDRDSHPHVVHVRVVAAVGLDGVGLLVDDPGAEVLEQGYQVRDQYRRTGPIDAEADLVGRTLHAVVQVEVDVERSEGLEAVDVGHGYPRPVLVAVSGGERVAVAPPQHDAFVLTMLLHQQLLEVVAPVADRRPDPCLECVVIDLALGTTLDDVVQPGEGRTQTPVPRTSHSRHAAPRRGAARQPAGSSCCTGHAAGRRAPTRTVGSRPGERTPA